MRRGTRMDQAKRMEAKWLYWEGMRAVEVAAAVGCSPSMVFKLMRVSPWPPRRRSPLRLSLSEREEISVGLESGESMRSVARRLKRAPSTICREVKGQGNRQYRAWRGDERAEKLAARPKPRKLENSPALRREVEEGLARNWSPQQIERRLRIDYPDNPAMHVSHETIYQALYVQGRGTLRKELIKHLRQRRTARRHHSGTELTGKIPNMVNISERPMEVDSRTLPGHWEGDLILGKDHQSAIGTLVERSTRYVMLLHLAKGKTAQHVCEALTKKIQKLPVELRRSLTWDQGKELSQHAQFSVATGVKVYFCDPHSPWQRGSNENTNGLLRQYFPKGTDLSVHRAAYLDRVARQLNGRPRQTLGWRTPSEKLNELLR
jgi:transposase, IS30 family